jgi:RNA polymerase sigma factor (sigma-70 family)
MGPYVNCTDEDLALLLLDAKDDATGREIKDEIVRRCAEGLLRFLIKNFSNLRLHDIEEVVNDALMALFKDIGNYKPERAKLRTWLCRIGYKRAQRKLDEAKALKRGGGKPPQRILVQGDSDYEWVDEPRVRDNTRDTIRLEELRAVINEELARMTPLRRDLMRALMRSAVGQPDEEPSGVDCNDAELALRHNTTVGNVEVQRSVARSLLREALIRRGYGPNV